MNWYLIRAATRQELRAVNSLREAGFAAYCPMTTRWERVGLRQLREKRQIALFPGYLFVPIGDGQFAAVESADGVSSVLRYTTTNGERSPRSVPHGLVVALRIAEEAGSFDKTRNPEAPEGLKVGQRVKVLVGAWWGHIATIISLDAQGRVGVLHTIFGRDTPASYDLKQLEAVA
jgi:transcription antitermination factor NusG